MPNKVLRHMPLVALMIGIVIQFYGLFAGQVIFWGVPLLQFYPWRSLAFELAASGELPLWNPWVGSGAPLLANLQTAVFYPPNWLYLIIPTEYAMGIGGLLHLVWAGLGMVVYLRQLEIGWEGQGVGSLSFVLGGYVVGRFSFLTLVSAVAWLPWLLWSLEGLLKTIHLRQAIGKDFVVFSGVVAMQLLAGHAQTSFYSLVMAGMYTLFRLSQMHNGGDLRDATTKLLVPLAGVMSGIMIAMIQLAPTLELMLNSQRVGGLTIDEALAYSFWPWRFLTLFSPNVFGSPATGDYWGYGAYWEDAVFCGLLTTIMGGQSAIRWIRERAEPKPVLAVKLVPFFWLMVIIGLFLALGKNNPVFVWMFDHIPGFDVFRAPTRWSLLAVFGIVVLGAIGIDGWRTSESGLFWTRLATAAGLSFFIAAGAAPFLVGTLIDDTLLRATVRLGLSIMFLGTLALLLPQAERNPRFRPWWGMIALALLGLDLVSAHWGLNPTTSANLYRYPSQSATVLADYLQKGRVVYLPSDEYDVKFDIFFDLKDLHPDGENHWINVREAMLPNTAQIAGVRSASNDDPLQIGSFQAHLAAVEDLPSSKQVEALQQMGVSLLMSPDQRSDLRIVNRIGQVNVYEVPLTWPYAQLAACEYQSNGSLACAPDKDGTVIITRRAANTIEVNVYSEDESFLLLLETAYPGWIAHVDGTRSPMWIANSMFQVYEIAAGDHEVVIRYRPLSLSIGAGGSAIGMLILALVTWPRTRGSQIPHINRANPGA